MCEFGCDIEIEKEMNRQIDIAKKVIIIATSHTIGGKIPTTDRFSGQRQPGEGRTRENENSRCTRGRWMGTNHNCGRRHENVLEITTTPTSSKALYLMCDLYTTVKHVYRKHTNKGTDTVTHQEK